MERVSLYHYESTEIKISIDAYFEGDTLVIDGYDIGKRVEAWWGDSDYEYNVRIPKVGIDFLFRHLKVEGKSRNELLLELSRKYNSNTCYSDIRKLMSENNIDCEGFTWV